MQRHRHVDRRFAGAENDDVVRRRFVRGPDVGAYVASHTTSLSARSGGTPDVDDDMGRGEAPRPPTAITPPTTIKSNMPIEEQKRSLSREFFNIALPAFVQLAAEPLAGLVDTAYLGRLGPEVLGGAGVAISAQYAVGKLYNDPLLRTSISLVASEDGRRKNREGGDVDCDTVDEKRALSMAVSSAMLLALSVGTVQLVLYYAFANNILSMMGVASLSRMHASAYSYMKVRALGTPAATLWLVTNGIYRGLGDTSTPLKYSLLFTALNAILDPIFIFTLNYGASGAAAGTALAQYVALIPLLLSLHRKVGIDVWGMWKDMGGTLREYINAGSYVLVRTVGKVLAYSVCARQAVSCLSVYGRGGGGMGARLLPLAAFSFSSTFLPCDVSGGLEY